MPRVETAIAGRDVQHSQELSTGLLTQKGDGSNSTTVFNADETVQYGQVQCWDVKALGSADQAYDSAAAIVNVDGSKPTRNCKYRIIKIETQLNVLRTGGTPDHDLKVQKGDGAASEAFSDVVATVDFDGDTVGLPTNRTLVPAQCLLSSGETLRCQFQISGSTTTGTGEVEFHIFVIPCIA